MNLEFELKKGWIRYCWEGGRRLEHDKNFSEVFRGLQVWLSSIPSTPPGDTVPDLATAFTGILILGIADSAASAIGRALGRHRILDTSKTVEGTLGGIVFCLAAWLVTWATCLLRTSGLQGWSAIGNLAVATTVSCLLEAATTQLDNIFLPLHHLALMAAAT